MDMLWPGFLLLLGLIPLLAAVYIALLRRRQRYAVRFSSLVLVREALPRHSRLKRHLPFALFLLALAALVVGLGRPVAKIQIPAGQVTVILAMDVSRSMCSTDILPNRLEVAKDAALAFIQRQPTGIQMGIVAFAGFAELVQTPTTDQEQLFNAVERLNTASRTAIGSAILESLDAIAEVNQEVAPSARGEAAEGQLKALPEGIYAPDIIVLLTDGASNSGPYPLKAAEQAAERGIRVYTIGFGTEAGGDMDCADGFWGRPMGGGRGNQGWFRLSIDEPTLMQIATMTGGEYYEATSAGELEEVFRGLPTYFATRTETTEISFVFAAVGAVLAALAIILSQLWHPLP